MNKFKVGDKVIYIARPDYVFEIAETPSIVWGFYRFKDCKEPEGLIFTHEKYRLATQEEIDTLLKDQEDSESDSKTECQDKIVCPHCYERQDSEFFDSCDTGLEIECNDCGSVFKMDVLVTRTFTTYLKEEKDADC